MGDLAAVLYKTELGWAMKCTSHNLGGLDCISLPMSIKSYWASCQGCWNLQGQPKELLWKRYLDLFGQFEGMKPCQNGELEQFGMIQDTKVPIGF